MTWVLAHFTNPLVGGTNTKTTQENGLTASKDSFDLATNGIKWLALTTSGGSTPLWESPYRMSRILAGFQFGKAVSQAAYTQLEGCPTYPQECVSLTPEQGLENVFQDSLFVGTPAGSVWDASPPMWDDASSSPNCVNYGKFQYCGAPVNFVQIYDSDVLYASGLSGCNMLEITGNPTKKDAPTCVASLTQDVMAMQSELDRASQSLLSIAESMEPW